MTRPSQSSTLASEIIFFVYGGSVMDSQLPAELLNLKNRFDHWRAHRRRILERMPDDLRRDALEMLDLHPPSLLRRVLKINPRSLKRTTRRPSISTSTPPVEPPPPPIFFQLSADASSPPALSSVSPPTPTDCRLQIDRPDGSRLTLTLPNLDLDAINRLCSDFLRA